MTLHVGLNIVFLEERGGGVGRYTRNLLAAFAELSPALRLTAFAGTTLPESISSEPWASEIEWVRLPVAPSNPLNIVAQLAAIPAMAARRGVDILHSPGNTGPIWARGPTVVTLHDLIWLHHPEDWSGSRRARLSTRLLATAAARGSTRVLTDSEASRRDIADTLGIDESTIDVAPLAADAPAVEPTAESSLRDRFGLSDRPFLLSVAQKRRYKRLDTAITAIAEIGGDAMLVLVGPPASHEPELRELARRLDVEDRVRFVDWVSEADLERLYLACTGFVLPSKIEGFGLPVLEAMAIGLPVMASDIPVLREVGGDAALWFDPHDTRSIAAALRVVAMEPERLARLSAEGLAQAAPFTWRRVAEQTLAVFEQALR